MVIVAATSVHDAFINMLSEVLAFLPRLLTCAVLLLIGYGIARLVRAIVMRGLRLLRFDRVAERAGVPNALRAAGISADAAKVVAEIVSWWIFLVFIEMAINALGLVPISNFLNQVLAYIPNVIAAALIILIGAMIANIVAEMVRGGASGAGLTTAPLLSAGARWAILIFAFLAALTQLHVATGMIMILFAGVVLMLAIAGGLALGLGGAETARGLVAGMAMGKMLQPGQRVQIGAESGTVVRHDLNSTIVATENGQLSIPNSSLTHERIIMLNGNHRQATPPRATTGAGTGAS
ncbi:MAG TPA: mechanosensitive ion channel domain-containing protein [Ktedonobacterales bacterium]|nr:mechanosensitive ion channel domain-containing protein [Ktedonobacterales bacterium]